MAFIGFWWSCICRGFRPALVAADLLLLIVPAIVTALTLVAGYRVTINLPWWASVLAVVGVFLLVRIFLVAPVDLWREERSKAQANDTGRAARVRRDVTLREAVYFFAWNDWRAYAADEVEGIEGLTSENLERLFDASQKLRQAALDGEVTIWGRDGFSGPLKEIPNDYWAHYTFETFFFYKVHPDDWKTERIGTAKHVDWPVMHELMTSKVQVEELSRMENASHQGSAAPS